MIYITGDTHGDFSRINDFCFRNKTTTDDVMIVLGDAGINYYGNKRDFRNKQYISTIPITMFCIHGNHEMRPQTVDEYHIDEFMGGHVYVESEFPNIKFAIDGEVYWFNSVPTIVIGGAYSVDKHYRLANGYCWFSDEQPDDKTKESVEQSLDLMGWNVECVLTHTAPLKFEPVEEFLIFIDQSTVDKSTEVWLDRIEDRLRYVRWYAGHYHCDKWKSDKFRFMYNDIVEFMD